MTRQEILDAIQAIFRNELGDQSIEITESSSANNIEQWDSVNNLIIISSIEEKFNISFPIEIIFSAENVGDLVKYIEQTVK